MPAKLLIVDDEPDLELLIRQKFRKEIRNSEFEFTFAHNGVEALTKLRERPDTDLVVTDINMPTMDGLTLLANLADIDTEVKAIIVSAYGDMQNIRTAMNRGALDFVTKPIDFRDLEITLNKTLDQVRQLKESLRAIKEKQRLEEEMQIARNIQRNLLPVAIPEAEGFEIGSWNSPCDAVGGDHYDFLPLSEGRLGVVVGDVSGHGVGAALLAATARAYLRALASRTQEPQPVLTEVNRLLEPDLNEGQFMTLLFGILEPDRGAFRFASAGHDPPLRYHAQTGAFEVAEGGDFPLGIFDNTEYEAAPVVHCQAGDILALCTDGVWEAADPGHTVFGKPRLCEVIKEHHTRPAQEIAEKIAEAVSSYRGGLPQCDDITIVILKCLETGRSSPLRGDHR